MLPSQDDEQKLNSSLLGPQDDDTRLDLGMDHSGVEGSLPDELITNNSDAEQAETDHPADGEEAALLEEDDDPVENPSKQPMGKMTKLALALGGVVVLGMGGLVGAQKMGLMNGAPAPEAKTSMPKLDDAPRPNPTFEAAPVEPAVQTNANNPFGPAPTDVAASGAPASIAPVDSTTPTVSTGGPVNPFDAPTNAASVAPAVVPSVMAPTQDASAGLTPPPSDPFAQQTTPPAATLVPDIAPATLPVAPVPEPVVEDSRVEKIEKPVTAKTVPNTIDEQEEAPKPKPKKVVKPRPAVVKKAPVVNGNTGKPGQQEAHPSFDQLTPKNNDSFYGYEKLF